MKKSREMAGTSICPMCSGSVVEAMETEAFPVGKHAVEISVVVPVMKCSQCEFSYTDFRAEAIRHDAACDALGILKPSDIKAIRDLYGMSLREFATNFHIGHASLERWEGRRLFISGQSNFYLRALQDKSVGIRLISEAMRDVDQATNVSTNGNVVTVNFKALAGRAGRLKAAQSRDRRFHLKRAVG